MPLVIRKADSAADFDAIAAFSARMAAWDASMTATLGLSSEGLDEAYYPTNPAALRIQFSTPDAAFLLAERDGQVLGGIGYARFDATSAEVKTLYLAESARGLGIGSRLLDDALTQMAATGFATAYLETAPFMQDAIRLYQSRGFRPCPAFRPSLPAFDGLAIFMDRPLFGTTR